MLNSIKKIRLSWRGIHENFPLRDEKGAVAVIVALVLPTLFVSLFVIVVDVGQIFRERRELVKIAEASALIIAEQCAKSESCPTSLVNVTNTSTGPLGEILSKNAQDGLTSIDTICGFDSRPRATGLAPCESTNENIYTCKNETYGYSFVRVIVSTKSTGKDSTFLRPIFAGLLQGDANKVKVYACAQAGWNAIVAAPIVFPMAIPICQETLNENPTSVFLKGYASSSPVFNYAPPGQTPKTCLYRPFGSSSATPITSGYFLKGMGFFNKVNDSEFGCLSPLSPKLVKIGDNIRLFSTSNDLLVKCKDKKSGLSMLETLGFENTNLGFGNFLDTYMRERSIYLPVLGECNEINYQECDEFEVVGFVTIDIRGLKMENPGAETGSGPSTPTANDWNRTDCTNPSETYCIYGEYQRAAAPRIPINSGPSPVDSGTQQVFLLP